MKKSGLIILFVVIISLAALVGCAEKSDSAQNENTIKPEVTAQTASPTPIVTATASEALPLAYKDGVYEGQSPLTSEAYYGKVTITVKDGAITDVDFNIYDTVYYKSKLSTDDTKDAKDMLMDAEYGKIVFADTPMYQEQVDNELVGIAQYEKVLKETQDIKEVDVMSKATWSYYIYQDAVKDALKKAMN